MKRRALFCLLSAISSCALISAFGTVVTPLALDEMIQKADFIADVNVLRAASFQADPIVAGKIRTRVHFQLNENIKGSVPGTFFLDFPGGTVGQLTRVVEGMPTFQPGQRLIVFGRNDRQTFSPLIGMDQGVLRIMHDSQSNVDRVYRWWGQPVNPTESFSEKKPVTAQTQADYLRSAESVQAFTQRLRAKINQE